MNRTCGRTDLLYREISRLVAEGKICEAEDLLYERLDIDDLNHLEMAVDFYQTVNRLDDTELERCNFSRDEIDDGLKTIMNMFGLQSLI